MDKVLEFAEAAELVREHALRLPVPADVERVAIECAPGRVLAGNLLADRDQPPFERSTRDGYALRAASLDDARPLRVSGLLRAGEPAFAGTIAPGEALEIMTGAPMPAGADSVLMVEHADTFPPEAGCEGVRIGAKAGRSLRPGENVVPTGSEARAASIVVAAGTRLAPMHVAAAVACGAAYVEVYRQPRVAILATGDELVEPGEPVLTHQIRNSNSYSLAAQVERSGGLAQRLPIVRDSLDDLRTALEAAMAADLVLLSGGVSMGKFDFVEQALAAHAAEFFFTGVRMQPGRPLVFGHLPGPENRSQYFFGLPGNPVSTMVTFALFVAPLLRAMGGESATSPLFARANITAAFEHKAGLTRFLPASLFTAWDRAEVTPVPWQGSGDLASVARANCFIVIPPSRQQLAAGDAVSVLLAYL